MMIDSHATRRFVLPLPLILALSATMAASDTVTVTTDARSRYQHDNGSADDDPPASASTSVSASTAFGSASGRVQHEHGDFGGMVVVDANAVAKRGAVSDLFVASRASGKIIYDIETPAWATKVDVWVHSEVTSQYVSPGIASGADLQFFRQSPSARDIVEDFAGNAWTGSRLYEDLPVRSTERLIIDGGASRGIDCNGDDCSGPDAEAIVRVGFRWVYKSDSQPPGNQSWNGDSESNPIQTRPDPFSSATPPIPVTGTYLADPSAASYGMSVETAETASTTYFSIDNAASGTGDPPTVGYWFGAGDLPVSSIVIPSPPGDGSRLIVTSDDGVVPYAPGETVTFASPVTRFSVEGFDPNASSGPLVLGVDFVGEGIGEIDVVPLRPGVPGDANGDGVADASDYAAWSASFGRSERWYDRADFNGDGAVTASDYTVWRDHAAGSPTAPTPEPSALVVTLIPIAWTAVRRRDRRPAAA